MGTRKARESRVITRFSVRADQNEPATQLMSHTIQTRASRLVGQVTIHPLQIANCSV